MAATYKVCIIGCGNIASGYNDFFSKWPLTHLAAYVAYDRTDVVGVCDIDQAKAAAVAKRWKVGHVYTDIDTMMTEQMPDIVSICTPCEHHHAAVMSVLKYPVKAIFCEKPIAESVEKAQEIVDACAKNGVVLLINHIRRFDRWHHEVKESLPGFVGDLVSVTFQFTGDIMVHGSHMFDLLRHYFGEISWVEGQQDAFGLRIVAGFTSGLSAIVMGLSLKAISIFDLSVVGSKGQLDVLNRPFWDYGYRYFPLKASKTLPDISVFSDESQPVFKERFERDFFVRAVDNLVNSIEGKDKPMATGEDAVVALQLVLATLYSVKQGGKRINSPFSIEKLILPRTQGEFARWQKN